MLLIQALEMLLQEYRARQKANEPQNKRPEEASSS